MSGFFGSESANVGENDTELKTVTPSLSMSLEVTCPHCEHKFDIFESHSNGDGEIYKQLFYVKEDCIQDRLDCEIFCPDETAQARFTDIDGDELVIFLAKTEGKGNSEKRIYIDAKLKAYIERQKSKPVRSMFLVSDDSGQQIKINNTKFKREFKKARDCAAVEAEATGVSFVRFQLKDIRAKAATDIAREHDIEAARLALGHTTQKQTQDYIRSVKHAGENARKRRVN